MERNDAKIKAWLAQRELDCLYRKTRQVIGKQQVNLTIDGQQVLSFCSNDYLGLASHSKVIKALQEGAEKYGVGSGASHLVTGHHYEHEELERELAEFTGREAALLFSSGYMANIGVVTAMMGRSDSVFQDRLNHASLLDASGLSGSKMIRYPHNNMASLTKKLAMSATKNTMIVTDAVFSMDGDKANIIELVKLAHDYKAWILLDDAHGFGVLGDHGAGLLEEKGLSQQDVPLYMATLGKAIGVSGAFVAGSQLHIEYLRQQARPWIYTTASSPALATAIRQSLKMVRSDDWRREKLSDLIFQFRRDTASLGLNLLDSTTPIQAVIVGSNNKAIEISQGLLKEGILVTAIRPPTVPKGTARLRITLSALHSEEDIVRLVAALDKYL
ncbi:MAG: 8-amino-7-oxononanoate synthase [Thiotrichaceae bacterium]|nr:8-amino-7-oxononanoate synthase [Thiotrichaceae bacterium]